MFAVFPFIFCNRPEVAWSEVRFTNYFIIFFHGQKCYLLNFLSFFSRPELPWSEVGFTYHFRSVFLWTEVHTGQKCYLLNFHEFFQRARTTLVRSRIYRLFHKFFSMDRSTCRSEVLFSHIILEVFIIKHRSTYRSEVLFTNFFKFFHQARTTLFCLIIMYTQLLLLALSTFKMSTIFHEKYILKNF